MLTLSVESYDNQCFAGQELKLKVTLTNASLPSALQTFARFDEQRRSSVDEARRKNSRSPPFQRGHRKLSSTGSDFTARPKRHVRKLSLVTDATLSEAIVTSPTAERHTSLQTAEEKVLPSPSTSPTNGHSRRSSWLNHRRRSSNATNGHIQINAQTVPRDEEIVMLHAQITGHFVPDTSLIKPESFEQLKGKAFTGGAAAGGLVGTQTKIADAWSFSNLKSILLDPAQSSLAELRETTSSRQVPVLSMPPTILGVEIKLRPGQSEKYHLRCPLPKSLPSTYQGKAVKFSYLIKLTAQRSDNTFKTAELPLRIFGSFAKMSVPYDCTRPKVFSQTPLVCHSPEPKHEKASTLTKQDFERYLSALSTIEKTPSAPLLPSPTLERSGFFNPESMHENLINYRKSKQQPVKFEIARAGQAVGIVSLPGVIFSAGQTITGTIDFSSPQLSCFGFELSLELSEAIHDKLAVKTPEQTLLATRRVLNSQVETTAFAREAIIDLAVPALAPPSFNTSAVQVEYSLLFEFMVSNERSWLRKRQGKHGVEVWPLETVDAESFECRIPIQVLIGKASEGSGGTVNW
jgi:hypothetical protein